MEKTNLTSVSHLQQLAKVRKQRKSSVAEDDEVILSSGANENNSSSSSLVWYLFLRLLFLISFNFSKLLILEISMTPKHC
jgi:hypothetical protein